MKLNDGRPTSHMMKTLTTYVTNSDVNVREFSRLYHLPYRRVLKIFAGKRSNLRVDELRALSEYFHVSYSVLVDAIIKDVEEDQP